MGDKGTSTQTAAPRADVYVPREQHAPSAVLDVKTSLDPSGVALLEVAGEVDVSNVVALRSAVDEVAVRHPDRLVLDMSRVTFIDSSGIHTLIAATQRIGSVSLRSPSWQVRRLVETMELTRVLSLER